MAKPAAWHVIERAWKDGNEIGDCSYVAALPQFAVRFHSDAILTWTPTEGFRIDSQNVLLEETTAVDVALPEKDCEEFREALLAAMKLEGIEGGTLELRKRFTQDHRMTRRVKTHPYPVAAL